MKNKRSFRRWIATALQMEKPDNSTRGEGRIKKSFINYIFCSDNYLLSLNKKHLKHNAFTDILTFEYGPERINAACHSASGSHQISGDIFISVPRVKENAKKFNTTFDLELSRVMIHGILHLCGYKDRTLKEKKTMRKMEYFYIHLFSKTQ